MSRIQVAGAIGNVLQALLVCRDERRFAGAADLLGSAPLALPVLGR